MTPGFFLYLIIWICRYFYKEKIEKLQHHHELATNSAKEIWRDVDTEIWKQVSKETKKKVFIYIILQLYVTDIYISSKGKQWHAKLKKSIPKHIILSMNRFLQIYVNQGLKSWLINGQTVTVMTVLTLSMGQYHSYSLNQENLMMSFPFLLTLTTSSWVPIWIFWPGLLITITILFESPKLVFSHFIFREFSPVLSQVKSFYI